MAVTPFRQDSPGWAIRAQEAAATDLEAFEPEEPQKSHSVPAVSERPPVSLAALKAADIQCDTSEAAAIGEALCRAFKAAHLLRRIKPEADIATVPSPVTVETVFIEATGRIKVTVHDHHDVPADIQAVARILSHISPGDVRLMPIISKALLSPPQFAAMDELSEALTAFEPPRRDKSIQGLYERWEKHGRTATAAASTGTEGTPKAQTAAAGPIRAWRAASRHLVAGALAIGAIAIAGSSAWFLMNRPNPALSAVAGEGMPPVETTPIAAPTAADAPPTTTVTTALRLQSVASAERRVPVAPSRSVSRTEPVLPSARTDSPAPNGRPQSAARVDRPLPSSPPRGAARTEPVPAPPTSRATNLPVPATTPPPTARAAADAVSVTPTGDVVVRSADGRSIVIYAAPEGSGNAPPARAAVSGGTPAARPAAPAIPVIYDARDTDVTPPIPVVPRLQATLQPSSPGVRLDALHIAVVVNEDGKAYSVSAVNPPRNMGEYVQLTAALSVVKGWQFTPATRAGAPVKYRLIVPVFEVQATGSQNR